MSEADEAISRLTAWVRDYGNEKNPTFIDDVNALLRAARAATDLLAACEACIAADELANADGTLGDDMVAAYDAAIAAAKAAIAKAKGE
jgi:hypothetical protein